MINKLKWKLFCRFLPAYVKEALITENNRLRGQVADLKRQLEQRDAYIRGLEAGIRSQRRIIIHTGEAKK